MGEGLRAPKTPTPALPQRGGRKQASRNEARWLLYVQNCLVPKPKPRVSSRLANFAAVHRLG
jgi:hypothetical protein